MKDYHNEESLDFKESLERLIYDCIHSFRIETEMRQNHIDYVVDHFIFANFNNKDYWFNWATLKATFEKKNIIKSLY